jgi:tetratricopeptide (TPR) repeat protein
MELPTSEQIRAVLYADRMVWMRAMVGLEARQRARAIDWHGGTPSDRTFEKKRRIIAKGIRREQERAERARAEISELERDVFALDADGVRRLEKARATLDSAGRREKALRRELVLLVRRELWERLKWVNGQLGQVSDWPRGEPSAFSDILKGTEPQPDEDPGGLGGRMVEIPVAAIQDELLRRARLAEDLNDIVDGDGQGGLPVPKKLRLPTLRTRVPPEWLGEQRGRYARALERFAVYYVQEGRLEEAVEIYTRLLKYAAEQPAPAPTAVIPGQAFPVKDVSTLSDEELERQMKNGGTADVES